ncbi:acyl-CoA carboxylase subunit beta [Desulfolucanica intricata]|uniref:acyl-CoA carboxylase subunit beta n=1 Tax=Desulfolucanica intricata TaxID=1285191 RepID=UPI0008301471|nr:carboxyl transferase domain-containing protein [Desulfolucanica intricata]
MSIHKYLEELTGYRKKFQQEKQNKDIKANTLTARERLLYLLDKDSFMEIGAFVSSGWENTGNIQQTPGREGVITGSGTIGKRPVYVFSQDFSVMGGSLGELHALKICNIMDLALKTGTPIIGLNESGGARIQEGINALTGYGNILNRNTLASGVIPQISVIMGACAGGAVYSPALTDFIFMISEKSRMFITGPQVVKSATGEDVNSQELGGAITHNQLSGVAHFIAQDEKACLDMVRKLCSYLPSNNTEPPPSTIAAPPLESVEKILDAVPTQPNKQYDVRNLLNFITDGSEILEVHRYFAQNVVTCFARLNGKTVGIVASQPCHLAGCLDIHVSDKIARFVRFCDCFNIPLITFVDVPGFLPGTSQEHGGIIRHGAKIIYAYAEATVPKIAVILRKAYGGGYMAMSGRSLGVDIVFAWPTAEIAVMGPEAAASVIYRDKIKNSNNPGDILYKKTKEYREKFANPYLACARGIVDDVIDPRETRDRLIHSLDILANKHDSRPFKKHGNIPL